MQTVRLFLGLEEYQKSSVLLEQVIEEHAHYLDAWYMLSLCQCKLSNFEEADASFQKVKSLIEAENIAD